MISKREKIKEVRVSWKFFCKYIFFIIIIGTVVEGRKFPCFGLMIELLIPIINILDIFRCCNMHQRCGGMIEVV